MTAFLSFTGITTAPVDQMITKPPLKAVPVSVTPLTPAPTAPATRGGLATCTFTVRGTGGGHR